MYFLKVNEKPTNILIIQYIGTQYSPTCFGTLKCHNQGVNHDPAEIGAQCRRNQRWMKLYVVAGDMMVILFITSHATIYSFYPSLIYTTLGIFLSRIMIDSLMMAF
jgi:hypothetical protein